MSTPPEPPRWAFVIAGCIAIGLLVWFIWLITYVTVSVLS